MKILYAALGLAIVTCLLSGCSEAASTPESGALVFAEAWQARQEEGVPFLQETSEDSVFCGRGAWRAEGQALEVSTEDCNFVTLYQPSRLPIAAGQKISVDMWWQTLASLSPTTGHIAVQIGSEIVLEARPPIPSMADARSLEVISQVALPVGTPIYFHVHNHGSNSWSLGAITLHSRKF